MNLSPQQIAAYDAIMQWHSNDDKRFVLAGYAGAGKTTLAKTIAENINGSTVFCAYTGKAANVLREKGCSNTSTIHGAIYKLVGDEENDEGIRQPQFILDEDSDLKHADLVIVDEYSMLPIEIREDLESLGKKVLYLGDPFQLPPVKGECDLSPDFFIEEIHRQALESPIIRYATDVRTGKTLEYCNHPEFLYAPRSEIPKDAYTQADQLIVGYNKTREAWNKRFRELYNFQSPYPMKGDKIICTKNNHQVGLFNGMIGQATQNTKKNSEAEIQVFFDGVMYETWSGNFKGVTQPPPRSCLKLNRFDFAYAITCHKSQGSEFNHVLIYNEPIGSDKTERARWTYTAITRARQKVTMVQP